MAFAHHSLADGDAIAAVPANGSVDLLPLTFSLVTTQAEFEALEPAWRRLMAEHGLPHQIFNEFNWLWHWANVFVWQPRNTAIKLSVVAGRRGEQLALILPLVSYSTFNLTIVRWMGEPISQYGDGLCCSTTSGEDWAAALQFVRVTLRPDVLYLRKIRADARIKSGLCDSTMLAMDMAGAPFIAIDTHIGTDQFEQGFSAKDRKNRRRHRKRLTEQGEVTSATYRRCESAAEAARQAIALKRRWLTSRHLVSNAVMAPEFEAFFQAALCHPERPTGCELTMLSVSGVPAAITVGIRHETYYAAHLTSYDPALEQFSPGSLLLEDNLRRLHEEGVDCYDFLAPAFKYKLGWASGVVETADYSVALSLRGRLYQSVYLKELRPRLRRLAENQTSRTSRLFVRAIQLSRLG